MKFVKYLAAFVAAVGLTTACTTDIEMVQIAPLDEAVAPVLHELPQTSIAINLDTQADKMAISWDAADFGAPVAVQYAVLFSLGENEVSLLSGIYDTKTEISNTVLSRLTREVEKGGLGIVYDTPTTVKVRVSASAGGDNVIYSEPRDLELTISEMRELYKLYAHSEGGWTKCYIYGWELSGCNFGDWPGTEITANKETVDGKEYYYFEVPRDAEGNTGNIIFNNGEGQQTQDITGVVMDRDRYFTIAAEATDGKYIATEQVAPVKPKLYVRSLAGWSKMYLYGWEVVGESFTWPGIEIINTEFVDDQEWYVYELKIEAFQTTGNIIFNNGEGQQTVDITGVVFDRDRFFEVSAAAGADGKFTYTEIGGGGEPITPTPPAEEDLTAHTWGLIGLGGDWNNDVAMAVEGSFAVAKNATIAAADQFKVRADGAWTLSYGAAGDVEPFAVTIGEALAGAKGGKNLCVSADGTYDVYFDLTNANIWVMNAGDAPAQPETPADVWGLIGVNGDWDNDIVMAEDAATGMFLAKEVLFDADTGFKIRANAEWDNTKNYGLEGGAGYVTPNTAIPVITDGGSGDMKLAEGGTYDVYFDLANTTVYVMTVGKLPSEAGGAVAPEKPVIDLTAHTWSLIGTLNATNWDTDFDMAVEGGFAVAKNVTIAATEQFKVRADKGWDLSYGAAGDVEPFAVTIGEALAGAQGGKNLCVPADGTYDIYFDLANANIWVMTAGAAAPAN